VGARAAVVAGQPAAHVVYAGDGRRISLFVAPTPRERLPERDEHVVDGVEVYVAALGADRVGWWQDGRHLYLAVSQTTKEDLLALASLCVRSRRATGG